MNGNMFGTIQPPTVASSHLGREDDILPYGGGTFWLVPFIEVHSMTNISPPLISLASQDSFPPGEAGGWLRDVLPFNAYSASSHLGREDDILPYSH